MKKTFAVILSALLLCGTASSVFAEDSVAALSGEEINLGLVAAEYLKGDMEMVSGPYDNFQPGLPEYGFDGDWSTTINYQVEGGSEYWFGVRFDQPTILTNVVFIAPDWEGDGIPDRKHCLHGCTLEGSNDGVNWEFIIELGDDYAEFEDYMLDFEEGITLVYTETPYDGGEGYYQDDDPEDPVAYTYYRVYNNSKGAAEWGDVELWGYFVEPEAPETEAPETEAPETEAPETAAPETAAPETEAPETAAPETEAPETAAPETEAPETEAPETEAPETAAPETAAPETAAPETEAPETAAPETEAPETVVPETAAPETAAPETAAPETTAPETTAPETAAPETAAPETTAPETTAPETAAPVVTPPTTDTPVAPQTFDAGIIAVVAAVVSAAGYAIAKKRK